MNIKCEDCGLSINPVANTHNCSSAKVPLIKCNGTCEDIGSISTCEKHTYFSTGANPPPYQGSEWKKERKYSGDNRDVC